MLRQHFGQLTNSPGDPDIRTGSVFIQSKSRSHTNSDK